MSVTTVYMNHIKKKIRYIDNITRRSSILWLVIRKWYLMIYNLMIMIETPAAAHSKTWIFLYKGTLSTPNISHTYICAFCYIWLYLIVWLCFITTYAITNSKIFTFLHWFQSKITNLISCKWQLTTSCPLINSCHSSRALSQLLMYDRVYNSDVHFWLFSVQIMIRVRMKNSFSIQWFPFAITGWCYLNPGFKFQMHFQIRIQFSNRIKMYITSL